MVMLSHEREEFIMLCVALDIASKKHQFAIADGEKQTNGEVANEGRALAAFFTKIAERDPAATVVMEATGVYHWEAAMAAHAANLQVSVINPKTSANFAKALSLRAKTDRVDAQMLLTFALRMSPLQRWHPPRSVVIELRAISRHVQALHEQLVATKNRLHAQQVMGECPAFVLRDQKQEIKRLEQRIAKASEEAMTRIKADVELQAQFDALDSITGIAQASAISILGELAPLPTQMRAKECVAHAGLDVRQHESGSSVAKPGRLSKQGNHFLRRAFYMPALVAIVHDPHAKAFYERLVGRGKKKMQALCAVMRKLLTAAWSLSKSRATYDGSLLFARVDA
jgi:transposase